MNGGTTTIDPEDQALTPRFLTSLHDLEVLEQDSIRIQCRVGGRPPPDIQWYSNGYRLVQDSRHKIIVNESGCHTLLISNIQLSDTGSLTCVARNRSGEAVAQVTSVKSFLLFRSDLIQLPNRNTKEKKVGTLPPNSLHTFSSVWSKTTLNTDGVGGAGWTLKFSFGTIYANFQ